ncbi:MAG: AIPR family protein [Firmicutes bacterium]|nr:AIPR family protein [Bacillota bacterium]
MMSVSLTLRKKIVENFGILENTAIFLKCEKNENIIFLEGEYRNSQTEVRFLIYDCSGKNIFDFKLYESILKDEEKKSIFIPVMIFDNLDQESNIRIEQYKKLRLARDKKELDKWFNEKIAVYKDCKSTVTIEVDEEGINYLEYILNEKFKGYIYNVSYYELKKILNITGDKLFSENVRIGIKNNKTGKKLKGLFKDYIKVGLFNLSKVKIGDSNMLSEFKEDLELDDEIIEITSPEKFWFYHNGVTIFSYDSKKISKFINKIELNPNKISVINGAQTLTNFHNAVNEISDEFNKYLEVIDKDSNKAQEWLAESLIEIFKNIKIKTIIIDGTRDYIKKISEGLNTQIPIEERDILAISNEVFEINKFLKTNNISITRVGEVTSDNNLNVIEYAKKYLIIKNRPGKSKNLSKTEIDKLIKESLGDLKKENFSNKLSKLIDLDSWWKELGKSEILDTKNYNYNLYKYGKYYFGSYFLMHENVIFDEENLYNLYNQFVSDFSGLMTDITLDEFKKDELFNKYMKFKKTDGKDLKDNNWIKKIDKIELCNYINKNFKSRYTIAKLISAFLQSKEISLDYFRVIAVTNKKVNEAYPFPRRTFNQLIQSNNEKTGYKKIGYENSDFKNEIYRDFFVFIIFWNDIEKIEKIEIVEKFSFKDYSDYAKKVFDLTEKAFLEGNENSFPKSEDLEFFHIRTKAINGDDTFEFTNGKEITKRTFWANKSTIELILKNRDVL